MIGAVFAGAHSEIAAALARDAEGQVGTDQGTGLRGGHILLPDMNTVAACFADQVGTIIQQEGDATGLRNRP